MRKQYIACLGLLLWVFCGWNVLPLQAQETGTPFIRRYLPKEYRAETQNWAIVQDNRGVIYVGNNSGVLEYDGVSWRLIPSSNGTVVRSLAISPNDGTIFAGAVGEVGFLRPSATGQLEYASLLPLLPEAARKELQFSDVWRTHIDVQGNVYFMANQVLLVYKKGKLTVFKPSKERFQVTFFDEDNRFYVRERELGLFVMENDKLKFVEGSEVFSKEAIRSSTRTNDGRLILATTAQGVVNLWEFKPNAPVSERFVRLNATPTTDFLAQSNLYWPLSSTLPGGQFVFGTNKKGVLVSDRDFKPLFHVDKTSGLTSNTTYYLMQDRQGEIWAGTSKGVSRIELMSEWTLFDESTAGVEGSVLSMARFNGKLYIGTGSYAYVLENNRFRLLEKMPAGQYWHMKIYKTPEGGQRLMAAQSGILDMTNPENPLRLDILDGNSAFAICPSRRDPSLLFVGLKEGVASIRWKGGKFVADTVRNDFKEEVRSIVEDDKGDVWLGTQYGGILHVRMNGGTDLKKATIIQYTEKEGLPSINALKVLNFHGRILFATEKGIYRFDEGHQHFLPETTFGAPFADGSRDALIMATDSRQNLWLSGQKTEKYPITLLRNRNGKYEAYDTPFRRLPEMETEIIFVEDSANVVWIGGSEGLFRYDANVQKNYQQPFSTLIRRVAIGEDSLIFGGVFYAQQGKDTLLGRMTQPAQTDAMRPVIAYDFNTVKFQYAAPFFDNETETLYAHYLEGYDEHWSKWSKESAKEYTNLPAGKYTFRVKARNIYGAESTEAMYAFEILSPWYMTAYAFAGYAILFGLLVWGVVVLNIRRLKAANERLERTVEERTADLRKANVEILEQKEEIEKSSKDIQTIGEIGQKITATLDMEELIQTVYKNVNSLTDASAFGVGVYDETAQVIIFRGFIENNEALPDHFDSMEDSTKLSVWCIRNKQEVIINDYENEYTNYVPGFAGAAVGDVPQSIIYMPLMIEGNPIGVITVQAFHKYAYQDFNISLLQTLASYVAIALYNANSFEIIKEKNQKIVDSIRYAKTIQQAVLPSREKMAQVLKDHFVYYKPKDIVSGDFFWFNQDHGKTFVAVVDCTGHGVPGAFMSLIGSALLTEIVGVEDITSPDKVLEKFHIHLRASLKQAEEKNTDGMDAAFCVMENGADGTVHIAFAGAKQSLFYYANGVLNYIRGDKRSIGGVQKEDYRSFTRHDLVLHTGDSIYFSTDGFPDQNAPDKKRFTSVRLRELLQKCAPLPMSDQREALKQAHLSHQQSAPQRDDITVIGIRL